MRIRVDITRHAVFILYSFMNQLMAFSAGCQDKKTTTTKHFVLLYSMLAV